MQHKLWSDLSEIADFLKLPLPLNLYLEREHFQHVGYKAGQRVCRLGQPFDALYFVYSGFLKTVMFDEFGNEQVLCFPMRGDILGLDSVHSSCYEFEVVALSDCNLIIVPYKKLIDLSRSHAQVEHALFDMLSRELATQHVRMSMLGKISAHARVCMFLIMLSERFEELGYSKNEFNLRMTRQEIGSYLCITLETVSRILSSLKENGIIHVHQRRICIHDLKQLRKLANEDRSV